MPIATMLTIGAAALLLLMTPFYMHAALERAGSAQWLGVGQHVVNDYSDRTVHELVFGPGTFELPGLESGLFYTGDERAHMRDARFVLFSFLALAALSVVVLAVAGFQKRRDPAFFEAVGRGGLALVVGTVVAGIFAVVAFGPAFELFHRLLFSGGNYSFDPATSRLVQLYPLAFWQLTAAALGALLLVGGLLTRVFGVRHARRLARRQGGGA